MIKNERTSIFSRDLREIIPFRKKEKECELQKMMMIFMQPNANVL